MEGGALYLNRIFTLWVTGVYRLLLNFNLLFAITLVVSPFSFSVAAADQGIKEDNNHSITKRVDVEPLFFLSTQMTPIQEADTMRRVILKDFPGKVDFQPYDTPSVFEKLALAKGESKIKPDLLGVLHGDMRHLKQKGGLSPIDASSLLSKRHFIPDFVKLGKLESEQQFYIPWMQATYIMAANRKALPYLPKGAKLDRLTYQQLQEWAQNMERAAGMPKLGFPAGPKGLMHRFFQGYLYPSFTGSTLSQFRSPEAVTMWSNFSELWSHVNPSSLTYNNMDESLLTDEVWVAWDHTARLISAFEQRPDDFVAFPAPIGPKGQGYMLVLAGLALSNGVQDTSQALELIDYLTRPDVQITVLKNLGFFPVVDTKDQDDDLPAGFISIQRAVLKQATSKNNRVALLPVGLGDEGNRFNLAYKRAFSQIVLRKRDIADVLDRQANVLRNIIKVTQASCWLPDPSSNGPCPVK